MSKSAKLESALRVAGTVALFVGLALMIVGCKVGPNYRRPAAAKAKVRSKHSESALKFSQI